MLLNELIAPNVLADLILLDTQAQIDYFVNTYKINKEKFVRIFVGANNKIYFPQKNKKEVNKFIVHWHGFIVPFYAVKIIIQAAEILKNNSDILFKIVTRNNKQAQKVKKLAKELNLQNIKFYKEKTFAGLAKFINLADICLGIFGNNTKAKIVIPNKIYEAIACFKPVITANHNAIKELFIHKENIFLVKPENVQDLANAILELKNNKELKNKIATNSYKLYEQNLTPKRIGLELKNILEKL